MCEVKVGMNLGQLSQIFQGSFKKRNGAITEPITELSHDLFEIDR